MGGTASTLSVTSNRPPSLTVFATQARPFFLLKKHASAFRFPTQANQFACSAYKKVKTTGDASGFH